MKVFIQTFGCSANKADTNLMKTLIMKSNEFSLVDDLNVADVVIINSCTVKQNAETKFWKAVRKAKELGKKVVAAGCVPQADESAVKKLLEDGISVLGVRDIDRVLELLKAVKEGRTASINNSINKKFHEFTIYERGIIGIVPINEGCLGNCSYCKTKFARGNLQSYDPKLIIRQVENLINQGVKEIWLTSQDTAVYGFDFKDKEYYLPHLIKDILYLPYDFKIRIGMMNPMFANKIFDNLLKLFEDNRLFRFLHVPIQSSSDKVLRDMKRGYSSKDVYNLFKKIRSLDERFTVSTDVICGYPTEEENDFDQTLKFVEYFKPDVINVSRFWPRPGTEAAKLKPLYNQVPLRRCRKLRELFNEYILKKQKSWVNWEGFVLLDEFGKYDSFIARNDYYKQIVIKDARNVKLGDVIRVKVIDYTPLDLRGEVI